MVKQSTTEGATAPPLATQPAPYAAPAHTTSHAGAPRFAGLLKIIRPIQLVLALIVLGLAASLVAAIRNSCLVYDLYLDACIERGIVPGHISFSVFNGVWTMLICVYFIVAALKPGLHHPLVSLVLDAVTAIFWFSGFIALAVLTGFYSVYTGDDFSSAFGILVAAVVFGVFEWILFVVTTVFSLLGLKSGSTTHPSSTPMQQYPQQGTAQHV